MTVDEQRAQTPLVGTCAAERAIVLGRRLAGERALPVPQGWVLLSPSRLSRHVLVVGATGAGKTETVMRLAYAAAVADLGDVFYLDGKGDRLAAERFCGLMELAGRAPRVFPMEPIDGWRGAPHELHGRLMEIIDYSSEGPAAWYRDIAKTTLHLACDHPDGPPRSSAALLARLDFKALRATYRGRGAVSALTEDLVRQVRLRYEAFFAQGRGALDGHWGWEDTDAAYVLLDSLALREETAGLSRFLFEDFAHYFTSRKPRERFCLLIVDEFSALAEGSQMASRVEQARGFRTGLVLAPQVVAGMGDPTQAQRIMGSVETVICHRVNTPEEIIALAGTRVVPELSRHIEAAGPSGAGSVRMQHQFKINPNEVRSLPPGIAWVINQ
jgi:hypothetical protein